MTNTSIQELAEVIADQNCQIRELRETCEQQENIIVDYELDQENQEKVDSALYGDLKDALESCDDDHISHDLLVKILDLYFGDHE